jgi:transposase
MEFTHFIGIDVSKLTLDVTLVRDGNVIWYLQTTNDRTGVLQIFTQLKAGVASSTLFCMEHTGIYNEPLLAVLSEKNIAIWLESSLHIKRSSGLQRGKNDKIDSARIAQYAYLHRQYVRLWQAPRDVVKRLRDLVGLRSRLIGAAKQLRAPLKENTMFRDKASAKVVSSHCKTSLQALQSDLKKTNAAIQSLIKSDYELNRLFNIVTSVDGIGPITAATLIITTDEFKRFDNPKQYASYAGVVPFEHRSGSSIRGRTRVSHLANKDVKVLLHLAAISARKMKGELRDYYERKIKEGKNGMCVVNAIRNKLIQRIFACVKRNQPYQKIFTQPLLNP